jgi:anti-sigma factor RsiW
MKDDQLTCPSKDDLVTYLYDEDEAGARADVERHLRQCAACRDEVAGLRQVRGRLAEWHAPELAAHARIVVEPERRATRWWVPRPAFIGAAAALLIMGVAAGLANLEVRYGADGFVLRTGWTRLGSTQAPTASAVTTRDAAVVPAAAAPVDVAPWRADLAALERQLREDFVAGRSQAVGGGAPIVRPVSHQTTVGLDQETLRRIQALIDEAEVRQQRNLALRVAELSRDFDLQRRADLVQIQQGLGQLEGRTEAEVARNRELVNYIMRVSQPSPR